MFTKNFHTIIANTVATYGKLNPMMPVRLWNGNIAYTGGKISPNALTSPTTTLIKSVANTTYGIAIGSGDTAPTLDDYELEDMLTSGFNGTLTSNESYLDEYGNPCSELRYTITNTSSTDVLEICEIGSFQSVPVSTTEGGSSTSQRSLLMDRTVLTDPVIIQPGTAAVIVYILSGTLPG